MSHWGGGGGCLRGMYIGVALGGGVLGGVSLRGYPARNLIGRLENTSFLLEP